MTVVTVRPSTTVSSLGSWSVTGAGGDADLALRDDSDATYLSTGAGVLSSTLTFGVPDPTIPAGAIVKSNVLRARTWKQGGSGGSIVFYGGFSATLQSMGVTWTTPTTGGLATATPSELKSTGIQVFLAAGPQIVSTATPRVSELFVDVTFVARPVADATSPTGTLTTTNLPTILWGRTLDADGGAQTQYEVKIFTAAEYGAGGFNPATAAAAWHTGASGVSAGTAGADTSWQSSTPLPDGVYRAYVRVSQTVNGALHTSDWDFTQFTISVALPALPTLVATAENAKGRIKLLVTKASGAATTDAFEIQASRDGGTTWTIVRQPTGAAISGSTQTAYDYEAQNGVATLYRARALHYYSGLPAASAWATDTETWSSRTWWIKHPQLPSLNLEVVLVSNPTVARAARQGILQPLGARVPIVVSDTRAGARGNIVLDVETRAAGAKLDALLDTGQALFLDGPISEYWTARYVVFGDHDAPRGADKAFIEATQDALPWIEVAAPAGDVAQAWPA